MRHGSASPSAWSPRSPGALVAAPTNGVAIVPAAVGVLAVVARLDVPVLVGFGLALVTIALIAVGAVPFGTSVVAVLAMMGGIAARGVRRAEPAAVPASGGAGGLLRERELAMREEAVGAIARSPATSTTCSPTASAAW